MEGLVTAVEVPALTPQKSLPSRPRTVSSRILALVILAGAFVDVPRRYEIGGVTGLAILTVLLLGLLWILWMAKPILSKGTVSHARNSLIFLAWAVMTTAPRGFTNEGLQNLIVFSVFLGGSLLAARETWRSNKVSNHLLQVLGLAGFVSVSLYGYSVIADGPGSSIILAPRQFALYALLPFAFFVAMWDRSKLYMILAILTGVVVAASLSRIAFAACLIIFAVRFVTLKGKFKFFRSAVWLLILVAAVWVGVKSDPVAERFSSGVTPMSIGPYEVESSGRAKMWPSTWESFLESPLIGKGGGSASALMIILYRLSHPHNDYLRIMHDYGVIGLLLWLNIWLYLLRTSWRSRSNSIISATATFAVLGFLVAMFTDNVVAYVYLLGPLGVVCGVALGEYRYHPESKRHAWSDSPSLASTGTTM